MELKDNQQAFDLVVKHLNKQRRRAQNENGSCRYRASDGKKCAVGCLIPDSLYSPDIEGKGIWELIEDSGFSTYYPALAEHFKNVDVKMLDDLQVMHDNFPVEDWSWHYSNYSMRYGLKYDGGI